MDDKLKVKVIFALGILTVVFLITTITSWNHSRLQEQQWLKEKALRFDFEEKAQKAGQESSTLSEQLKKTQESLQESVKEFEATKKALIQSQMVNQNLKTDLNKLSKLKEALEDDLKKALVDSGKKTVAPVQK